MFDILILLKYFIKKEYVLFKRYWFNSLNSLVSMYIVFLLIFLGYKSIAGNALNFSTNIEGLVVGYVLLFFVATAYAQMYETLYFECKEGTLEQLYMAGYPFSLVLVIKTFSKIIFDFISIAILLILAMITTGRFLNIDIISLIPLLTFTLLCFYGIGMIVGGIGLISKKADGVINILSFILFTVVFAPVDKFPILKYLPGSMGSYLIKKVMISGKVISDFSLNELFSVIFLGIFYLTIGCIIYKICEVKAMEKGLIGHY